jgi:hypothetical protein
MKRIVPPFSILSCSLVGLAWLGACSAGDRRVDDGPAVSPPGADATEPPAGSFAVKEAGAGPGAMAACVPNPANVEVPGNMCDDDGDGIVDNPAAPCDGSLPVTGDAAAFARAIGICQVASPTKWGLVAATFSRTYMGVSPPHEQQHGILSKFGDVIKPREGHTLGVLSSGVAREYDLPDGVAPGGAFPSEFKGTHGAMNPGGAIPPGYPKAAAGCSVSQVVRDVIDFKIQVKVPGNARGVQFDFDFWSGEWPEFICTKYNDGFIAYLTSQSFNGGAPDNMSFDSMKNPVSVNNGFFDRCTPGVETGCASGGVKKTSVCTGGEAELAGTGFALKKAYCAASSSAGGATGWLTSTAPVKPGETMTLEFIIWDTGDTNYDSSVLIDNLRWVTLDSPMAETTRPPR